ncbi:ABC transporter G family member 15-like [Dorcoceras hygrometricum]|uniref:ABC transporter G family member 15-like n=1 Tax=Dorcoceras hygrometricum TaxID=472368 RepID=A0A2Z7ABH1_9LAMI|nr:ABC transporter G family member 15-like [Dorcoceras hygrometricum]
MLRLVVHCSCDWFYARSCCVWMSSRELWSTRVSAPVLATGCVGTLRLVPDEGSVVRCFVFCVWMTSSCIYFQPFVPYLSNPRTLFSRELFRRFPVVSVVVLARARILPESSGFLAGLVVAQYKRLVVQLREIVRYCSLQLVMITVVSDWICLAWLEISSAVGSCVCWFGKLLVSTGFVGGQLFEPFVPYLSNPRTLFSRELFRRFPVVSVVVLARARLLPECSGFLAGLVVAQYKDVRASGDTALSSPCWDRSHHEPSDVGVQVQQLFSQLWQSN